MAIKKELIMLNINRNSLRKPEALVLFYLVALSFTFIFVDRIGGSTLIDELALLVMVPIAAKGLIRSFHKIGISSWLFLLYFFMVTLSSFFSMFYSTDVPVMASMLGVALDIKFLVFVGALLYLVNLDNLSSDDVVVKVCKVIVIVSLMHAAFIFRDILSNGVSLSGLPLQKSKIFGYIPIGLFSHKINTAMLTAIAIVSSAVLYINSGHKRYVYAVIIFSIILILSSSVKELMVLVALAVILVRLPFSKKVKIRSSGIRLIAIALLVIPFMAAAFGSTISNLISYRVNTYFLQEHEETVRGLLYEKSILIANDYFPIGSGSGTYSSSPSRSLYYSPLYYKYGLSSYYGASPEHPYYLMDVGWAKFFAESGWIGGLAYFLAFLIPYVGLVRSFVSKPRPSNIFGVLSGALIFSSALAAPVFTDDLGILLCGLFFMVVYMNLRRRLPEQRGV